MKKVFYIIVIILFIIFLGGWLIHYLHRNSIVKQEVHRDSKAILILALDNIMLKNTDEIRTLLTNEDDTSSSADQLKELATKSGLAIPPKLFFFALTEQSGTWYAFSKIKDLSAWESYMQHRVDKDSEDSSTASGAFIKLNSHIALAYNKEQVLWQFSNNSIPDSSLLLNMLADKGNRRPIRYFRGIEKVLWDHDLVYTSDNADKYITANIQGNEILLDGEWEVSNPLPPRFQVRQIDTAKHALVCWNAIAMTDSTLLSHLIRPLRELGIHTVDYMDFVVEKKSTTQLDTAITYDYDADFNTIEKREIIEKEVPVIRLFTTASSGEAIHSPFQFFYTFYPKTIDQGIILSTQEEISEDLVLRESNTPFFFRADFQQWPKAWTFGPFVALQQKKMVISLQGQPSSEKTLHIRGKVLSEK
ncbi:hypothetical protein [Sphingobacterium wenxiniae]|uniref:Uncharacterized protein n=1 Tax=Sphingobacterium wenxiniae TaxID=683125 RepID=A0A1I6QD08_9SPHI|nr:hypothetical protein [Sphingobacterium wenxiniae]SFS50357.1 hypothetical protein SAMN05660206_102278 [Sphingobacterium wenxiniae]